MTQDIAAFKALAAKCTRCGSCQSVCPVHHEFFTEDTCARGKMFFIRSMLDDNLEMSKEIYKLVSNCLLCKACTANCPSGVKTDELFLLARNALAEKVGLPFIKKICFTSLTYKKLFDLGLRLGSVFQGLVLREDASGVGRTSRIPLPAAGLNKRRLLPALSSRPLRKRVDRVTKVDNPKARVAFFPGCMANYVYPEVGEAVVKILKHNNVEVTVFEELSCCGIPAVSSGDFATGRLLAENNVGILASQPFDAIITACASCGSALQHEYGVILEGQPGQGAWEGFKDKVYDIMSYFTMMNFQTDFTNTETTVTYHDPCHLVRGMNVSKEPREVIKSVPGLSFVEMQDANRCCGCGGTFSLTHYDTSRKINDMKLDNAENTGAELLLTGCSACRMHITDGLSHRNGKMKVMHTAEFIANAYPDK